MHLVSKQVPGIRRWRRPCGSNILITRAPRVPPPVLFFFFNDPAPPEIYPLSHPDPLPIFCVAQYGTESRNRRQVASKIKPSSALTLEPDVPAFARFAAPSKRRNQSHRVAAHSGRRRTGKIGRAHV